MNKIDNFIHSNKIYSKCSYAEQLEIDDEINKIKLLEQTVVALSIEGEEKCEKIEKQAKEIAELNEHIKKLEEQLHIS